MIRVKRPQVIASFTAPDGKAVKETISLIALVAAAPDVKIKFKSSIWKAAKIPYWRAQNSKCVFCEGFVPAQAHGDVEHFRPKSGVSETRGAKKLLKTYWWLAYDWTNYWASCQICNQSFKKNLFPLEGDGARAMSPDDDISLEKPLLLDPGTDNPQDHLIFKSEEIFPKNGSLPGQATIEICGLNRPALVELRRLGLVSIRTVLTLWIAYPNLPDLRKTCARALKDFMEPQYPYSAMARDLVAREAPELLTH